MANLIEFEGRTWTSLELLDDEEAEQRYRAHLHAEQYPDGCRDAGHMCEACTIRTGDTPHRYVKVGARRGYRGRWVCNESGCPFYMTEG